MDFFLPDWAPNIHPLLVHFPIVLFFLAVVLDVTGFIRRQNPFWRKTAVLVYALGGVALVATYFAGRQAADTVFLSDEANAALTEHADLGLWSLWVFGIYTVVRLAIDFTAFGKKTAVTIAMIVVPAAALVLLYETAEHGAELVYRYGAGVAAVDHSPASIGAPTDSSAAALSAPVLDEEGGWTWKPTRSSVWKSAMTIPAGGNDFTRTAMMDGGDHGDVLALTTEAGDAMFVFDAPLTDIQVDFAADLDDFDGVLMLVHHVTDSDNYHFTSIGNGEMRQGRSENGDIILLDAKPFQPSGWQSYRVVSDGTHARAYAEEALVTHGHGPAPGTGPIGIRLNGTGTVLLDFIRAKSL